MVNPRSVSQPAAATRKQPVIHWPVVAVACVFALVATGGLVAMTPHARRSAAAPSPLDDPVPAQQTPSLGKSVCSLEPSSAPRIGNGPATNAPPQQEDAGPGTARAPTTGPTREETPEQPGAPSPSLALRAGGAEPASCPTPVSDLLTLLQPNRTPGAPEQPAGGKTSVTCAKYGTSVNFVDNPREAADLARREKKLLLVLHVAGNFEDDKFT